jgi:hypothetical protein
MKLVKTHEMVEVNLAKKADGKSWSGKRTDNGLDSSVSCLVLVLSKLLTC